MSFKEKLDVKLIELIKNNPVIYDFNHGQYMDFNQREVVWQKIGDELRRPASECKSRWINIRDIYRRQLRKMCKEPGQRIKAYKYDNELMFLRPYFKDVVFFNSFNDADESVSQDDSNKINKVDIEESLDNNYFSDAMSEDKPLVKRSKISSTSKKKKKKRVIKNEVPHASSFAESSSTTVTEYDAADPVDAFLLSIGSTLKTFSPYRLNLAKSQIFSVVQEHDLKQIVERQNHAIQPEDMKMGNISIDPIYHEEH